MNFQGEFTDLQNALIINPLVQTSSSKPKLNLQRLKSRKRKHVVTFDPQSRKDFITGFHKRKVERRKKAQVETKKRIRQIKSDRRKQRLDELEKQGIPIVETVINLKGSVTEGFEKIDETLTYVGNGMKSTVSVRNFKEEEEIDQLVKEKQQKNIEKDIEKKKEKEEEVKNRKKKEKEIRKKNKEEGEEEDKKKCPNKCETEKKKKKYKKYKMQYSRNQAKKKRRKKKYFLKSNKQHLSKKKK
ncbi:nucleolar protein [Anaeramoeba flamelloides]|uniref:Nucleolar protein n=1 Tax=Anaeramoeba flamelloides TaxID=1746091 RepID=A0ABQ8Y5J5_9EUKA|nr:nucleolar protein [Anaeramoeba flamelloides]